MFVGDPHVVWDEIEDCNALINQVLEVCTEHNVDTVIWLGDLHHTHSIVRIEVMEWWNKVLGNTLSHISHIVIVGNHDRPTEQSKSGHALIPLQHLPNVTVIDKPKNIQNVLFLPYINDTEVLIHECNSVQTDSVVCHATFIGSKFSNGFIPDGGVDETRIKQNQVISGHIHVNQQFGKVFYPGSPRWRDMGEANEDKSIFIADLQLGTFSGFKKIKSKCRAIKKLFWQDEQLELPSLNDFSGKLIVEINGSRDYIAKASEQIKKIRPGAIIKPNYTEKKENVLSEARGIQPALMEFLKETPEDIFKEIIKRVYGN